MNNDDGGAGPSDKCQPNKSIDPKSIVLPRSIGSDSNEKADDISKAERWAAAGFNPFSAVGNEQSGQLNFMLPDTYVAIRYNGVGDRERFIDIQKALALIPNFRFHSGSDEYSVYRLADQQVQDYLQYIVPMAVELLTAGAIIPLPNYQEHVSRDHNAKHIDEIATIEFDRLAGAAGRLGLQWPPPDADPVMPNVPLLKHSLQGQADALEVLAKAMRPLLGQVCLSGQATIWYAAPNSGKTLIGLYLLLEAIRECRLAAGNVYYINADDNSAGLAEKLRILQDVGAHMLVPGFKNLRAQDMQGLLLNMAQTEKARGVIVVIDTIKKFASLMDKRDSSTFADACRQFVMRGGTVLAFAHTNKNPSPNGTLRYAGTTDFVEDFDAAYLITPLELEQPGGERVVRFDCIKRRGDNPDKAAYAYSTENGLTYDQLLASVEAVTFDKLGEIERHIEQRTDAELVEAVKGCIRDGIVTKMHIASEAAKRTKTSGKGIIKILDRYTGDDPAKHHWTFTIGERGKHIYQLLPKGDPTPD